ncbi:hypothetical protein [Labilibaculum euxinus]
MGNEELQPSPFGSFMVMIKEQPVWLEDKGQKNQKVRKSLEKSGKVKKSKDPINQRTNWHSVRRWAP